jgi:hypothetical protein
VAEAKKCRTCKRVRPLTDVNMRERAPDARQARCRECSREWYLANKEEHVKNVGERNRHLRTEYADRLARYLLEHPCADCGEDDVRVLDVDHEYPAEKLTGVGRLVMLHRLGAG